MPLPGEGQESCDRSQIRALWGEEIRLEGSETLEGPAVTTRGHPPGDGDRRDGTVTRALGEGREVLWKEGE